MADNIPSIIKAAYYAGQLLQVADFNREQDFHIQYRNFQTRQLLSAGVISGLLANGTSNHTIIGVTPGAAINNNGEYILLTADKSYTVIEADGDYQLIIKPQWVAVPGEPNQLKSDPGLNLIAPGTTINEGVLLANVTIKDKLISKIETVVSAAKILSSVLPDQPVQNLDAAVVTTGIFNTNLIPDLQSLNGKLTQAQLPELPDKGSVVMQNSFTAGVVTGLEVSNTDKTVRLKNGAATDESGNQIILDKNATYDNNQISPVRGSFSLDMSDVGFQDKTWLLLISQNSADTGAPILEFTESSVPVTGKVILATITITADSLTLSNDGRNSMLLKTDRLPELTADLIPGLQRLNGRVTTTQLPDMQDLNGKLNADQIPDLQNLNGKLTEAQLPAMKDNGSVVIQNSFTAGVVTGLEVSNTDKTVRLKNGAAIDESGNQVILDKNATYDNNQISPVRGSFSLDMSDAGYQDKTWFLLISQNSADAGAPILEFTESSVSVTGKVVLATITITADSLTLSNDGRNNMLLKTDRLPELTADLIPNLQDLSGKLTLAQLPELPPAPIPALQDLSGKLTETQLPELTPGLIPNLENLNGKLTLAQLPELPPAPIPDLQDLNGKLTEAQLPELTPGLIPNLENLNGKLTLAQIPELPPGPIPDLQDLSGKLTLAQLPELTPALIPNLQNLNGKIAVTQLPDIQEMNGKLNAGQIPDLQNLSGRLTTLQLPPDMDVSKEYITFFTTGSVVSIGSEIQLSWSANGVDSLSLSYFSEMGINMLSTNNNGIKLTQSNYAYTLFRTTTFTLTAQIKDTIVDQKQLTITVFTALSLAELQFLNKRTASDCVTQLKKQFPSTTAQESAIILGKVGYAFEDTGRAVKNGYNIADATEFGKTMAAAFPA